MFAVSDTLFRFLIQLTETLLHGQPGVNAVKVVVWAFKLVTGPASIPGLQMAAATAWAHVLRHRNVRLNLVSVSSPCLHDFTPFVSKVTTDKI